MSCTVYANGDAIACKAGADMVIAAFPDVCLSPPSPPAGPVPVPYPDTSASKDMQKGSKKVMIQGKEAMLKDQSYYNTSPLGDEAATKGLGASVLTHVITGKTYFVAWSMDVLFEDQNVDRHTDLTTSNHASPGPATPPKDAKEKKAEAPKDKECPCCKIKPPHDNQWDPATGEMYKPISEEEFYKEGGDFRRYEVTPDRVKQWSTDPGISDDIKAKIPAQDASTLAKNEAATKTLADARKKGDCPNLHKKEEGCGQYLNKTNPQPKTSTAKDRRKLGFTDAIRDKCLELHPNMADGKTPIPKKNAEGEGQHIAHMTPLSAGGCPVSQDNLIPKEALSDECKAVDDAQSTLQVDKAAASKAAIDRKGKAW